MGVKQVSFEEFNDLFSRVDSVDDYPTEQELKEKKIPFSDQLSDLAYNEKYKDHNEHVKDVVVKANCMLKKQPSILLQGVKEDDQVREDIDKLFFQLPVWSTHYRLNRDYLIRAAAVYHDIGKWIVRERHPTEGYYLCKYLFPDEEKSFQRMVGSDAAQLLLSVIRDHDKFGIISTGEASLNVIIDLFNPAKTEVEFYNMSVVTLMLTNFSDIAVSAPDGFSKLQAEWIAGDVKKIITAISEGRANRLEIGKNLLEMDSDAKNVTTRIARLVDASYKNAKFVQKKLAEHPEKEGSIRFDEKDWEVIPFTKITDIVNSKLQVHFLGTAYQKFCSDFAHYCKLDYALYFFGEVARQLNVKRVNEEQSEYPIEDLVGLVVHILKSIVETYRELISESEATYRRIGIQMQSLLRSGVKETVTGFLAGTKGPQSRDVANVVSWVTNEVSAWLFI
jgi:predicted transcriptional regulator